MRSLILPILLFLASCSSQALPGGYTIAEGMNREWLEDSKGTLVTPGLIQRLYTHKHSILLVALAASSGNEPLPPRPIDGSCLVALLIDTDRHLIRQMTINQADKLSVRMTEQIKRDRPCIR
jgi:hypothetical protein